MTHAKAVRATGCCSATEWTLRPAIRDDLEAAQALMRSCHLPAEGIAEQFGEAYVVAEREGRIVGVAGVERHGAHGLLRSVAVTPPMRGAGLGATLVADRLAWADAQGIQSLFLLTMDAKRYFARHGFVGVERSTAPPEIQTSSQFAGSCPSSAALMQRVAAPHPDEGHPPDLREAIRDRYARAARAVRSDRKSGCCGGGPDSADGCSAPGLYTQEDLEDLPGDAVRASLGCGNPVLLAELREGETVLDLGSGGGIDVLLSARRVGPRGKAYGLDMTDEMLDLARGNQRQAGVENVEFLKGHIEAVPLPDASVDVILSNCVINLSTDKRRVLDEAFRVLKPGGRFAVSDILVHRDLPDEIRRSAEMWAGCVAGALEERAYRDLLRDAGFHEIEVVPTRIDDAVMSAFIRATKPAA